MRQKGNFRIVGGFQGGREILNLSQAMRWRIHTAIQSADKGDNALGSQLLILRHFMKELLILKPTQVADYLNNNCNFT